MLLIILSARADSTFINSENSKAPVPYGLLVGRSVKTDLKRIDKYVALSNLCIYYTWKNIKKSHKNNKFKISNRMKDSSYLILMFCVRYSRLFWVSYQKAWKTDW